MTVKNYHISFFGNLPEVMDKGSVVRNKIQFTNDALHFETKQQLMEFFDDPEKIAHYLGKTGIVKMMLDNHKAGHFFAPTVQVSPYFQGESGSKLWFDDMRDVDLKLPMERKTIITS